MVLGAFFPPPCVVRSQLRPRQAQRLHHRYQLIFHYALCFTRVLLLLEVAFAFGFFVSISKLRFPARLRASRRKRSEQQPTTATPRNDSLHVIAVYGRISDHPPYQSPERARAPAEFLRGGVRGLAIRKPDPIPGKM
jgi:hypothetical protein